MEVIGTEEALVLVEKMVAVCVAAIDVKIGSGRVGTFSSAE